MNKFFNIKYVLILLLLSLPATAKEGDPVRVLQYDDGIVVCIVETYESTQGLCGALMYKQMNFCDITNPANPNCSESI